jgi:hypothetical protein
VFQQLVDRPLVVGVSAVLLGDHGAVRRDEKVGGQAEPPTLLLGRGTLLPAARDRDQAARDGRMIGP